MSWKRKTLLAILILLTGIQFFQQSKSNPVSDPALDLIHLSRPDEEITALLKNACYDCHSHQTHYPWYAYVAPVSWLVSQDIEEGREHLNFSLWGNYSEEKADHKLEECYEEVLEGEMPMDIYTYTHPEARLTDEEKEKLVAWFRSMR